MFATKVCIDDIIRIMDTWCKTEEQRNGSPKRLAARFRERAEETSQKYSSRQPESDLMLFG